MQESEEGDTGSGKMIDEGDEKEENDEEDQEEKED